MHSSSSPIACPGCDLLLENVIPAKGHKIYCPRCNTFLNKHRSDSVSKVLAISLSGILLYVPAIFRPLMTLEALGMTQSGSVFDAFLCFYKQKYYFVSVIIFLTSIFFPLFKLCLLFAISLQLKVRLYSPSLPYLFRISHHLEEWSMSEIYLIGIFIMIIKVQSMAVIHFDIGFYSFIFLVFNTVAVSSVLDSNRYWYNIETLKRSLRKQKSNEQ